jgi:hypothetical protein
MIDPRDADKLRTPNLNCPACLTYTRHSEYEWRKFHPDAGKGVQDPWTQKKPR